MGSAYTQNFNTLSNTAGSTNNNLVITGWFMTESGGGPRDNEQYGVDTGGSSTGDTYSFGATGSTERALGGLQSGTLIPFFGSCYTNNTGATINSISIGYTGEQWRLGTAARTDQLNFEMSTNATSLTTGTWVAHSSLDFVSPFTTTTGELNGNAAANRTMLSYTITGLSIAPGATFWIRWTDVNASGSDDGLAVDDFSLTPQAAPNLSINDVSLSEGNAGTTNFTFTVSLSAPAPVGGVTFDIATANGTATTGNNDYVSQSLTSQTIPAGQTSYNFIVAVNGDGTVEPNETFFVNVTNVTGATVTDGQGQGTIVNEDACPTPTITATENWGAAANDGIICRGNSVMLTASGIGGDTYVWSTGEVTASITVAPLITTTYTVTVTNGSCVSTASREITVNPLPAGLYTVTGGGAYCGGGSGLAVGLSDSDMGTTYFLYRNNLYVNQFPGTDNALNFGMYTAIGTYDVVASDNTTRCFVPMNGEVEINTDGPSFTVTPTNGTCPENEPFVTLDAPANSGYKYDITTGNAYTGTMTLASGGTLIESDPEVIDLFPSTPAVTGTTYTLRLLDLSTGCFSDQTFTVSAIPENCDCVAPPFVNFTPLNSTSCNAATVTIGYTVQNGPAIINTSGFLGSFSQTNLNNGTGTFTYTPAPAEIGTTLTIFASIADPDGGGVCEGDTASANIQVNPLTEPTFFSPGTFCEGAAPTVLPTTSNNGIMGTWNPSSINTSTPGTYTFVFTPNPGQCADTASVKARVVAKREPTFTVKTTYCEDETTDALPGVSLGGETGTWNPSSINTSTPGTFTFVFTPTPGACVDTASIKVTVNPKVEPTFSILSSYCQGQTPANLPTTSNNGVAGTWNPSTISTATPGTITYVFTPDNAECTDTASLKVVVSQPVTVEAGTPQTLCVNQVALDLNDLNASISGGATTGTWSSSGTGSFIGGTPFGAAIAYLISPADKAAGTITLTLTSADPVGPCPAVVDTVVITIRNLNCSTFPWNGGK